MAFNATHRKASVLSPSQIVREECLPNSSRLARLRVEAISETALRATVSFHHIELIHVKNAPKQRVKALQATRLFGFDANPPFAVKKR